MAFSVFSLVSGLLEQARKLRNESDRRLLQATCSAVAIILSVIIGLLCQTLIPYMVSLTAGTILSSAVLIPLSIFIANSLWGKIEASWVTSGDIFKRMRYLELEYNRDVSRINNLQLPQDQINQLVAERYKRYLDETTQFRDQIRTLNKPSQSNLLKP